MSARSGSGRQWRNAERFRQFVDLLDQSRRQRHAVLLAVGAAHLAALTGDADLIDAGKFLRRRQVMDMAVHFGLEHIKRQKFCDVEGDDEMPGVALTLRRRVDVLHVAAEGRAIERSAKEPEDGSEAGTF